MTHLSRQKANLINRTKKIVGQFELLKLSFEKDAERTEILRRLSVARNLVDGLMAEMLQEHILDRVPPGSKPSEKAADDIMEIVRTYLR